jgi:transketolase
MGWDRYLGKGGRMVGLDRFGASAPGPELMRELGITVDSVVTAAHEVLAGAQMQGEATR